MEARNGTSHVELCEEIVAARCLDTRLLLVNIPLLNIESEGAYQHTAVNREHAQHQVEHASERQFHFERVLVGAHQFNHAHCTAHASLVDLNVEHLRLGVGLHTPCTIVGETYYAIKFVLCSRTVLFLVIEVLKSVVDRVEHDVHVFDQLHHETLPGLFVVGQQGQDECYLL